MAQKEVTTEQQAAAGGQDLVAIRELLRQRDEDLRAYAQLEETLQEAMDIINKMEDALEKLNVRLDGLSGAAEAGQFALDGDADCGVAVRLFFSLSESLRDESKAAEAAGHLLLDRCKENSALKDARTRYLFKMHEKHNNTYTYTDTQQGA